MSAFTHGKPLYLKHRPVIPRESDVEKYFCWRVKQAGGGQWKWGSSGGTDRIVVIFGYHFFVELKALDGRVRRNQKRVHQELKAHGAEVFIVVGHKGVDKFMAALDKKLMALILPKRKHPHP